MPEFTVFIGRFQPFHAGHYEVVKEALEVSNKLIMFLGSADSPRESRNPYSYEERIQIIKVAVLPREFDRIIFKPANDYPYNDARWVAQIVDGVDEEWNKISWHSSPKKEGIALIGHRKDHTSYYLDMFPQWGSIGVKHFAGLNATDIRQWLYDNHNGRLEDLQHQMRAHFTSYDHGQEIWYRSMGDQFEQMVEEGEFITKTKQMWSAAPYPVTFVTVDAVVTCANHLLLIQRRAAPGKGLWALPGGYLDTKERIVDSMIRELDEETKLSVPRKVIRGSITGNKVYDAVERSARGRIITHAYRVELNLDPGQKLPKIKGSDDAAKAKWFPLSDVRKMKKVMFEDHYGIIDDILGGI